MEKEGLQMYKYQILEDVLKNIAKDGSTENIYDQIDRLTSDELRKLKELVAIADDAANQKLEWC